MQRALLAFCAAVFLTAGGTGCQSYSQHKSRNCSFDGCSDGGAASCENGCAEGCDGACGDGNGNGGSSKAERRRNRRLARQAEEMVPAGPPAATYAYPYYTVRGPRDFFLDGPSTIGY